MDLDDFINKLFRENPQETCTYNINLPVKYDEKVFKILFYIMINGARILYGNDITPNDITLEQFSILNKYMSSIGYTIEYEYVYKDDIPIIIHIWFKRIEFVTLQNCKIVKL
jgi:hypothetical protein